MCAREGSARSRLIGLVALAIGVVLVGGAGSATGSGSRAAADPFKIYVITGINVPVGNQPATGDAVKAAVARVNSAGGFGGRPGTVDVCNNLGTAAGTAACAQNAVDAKADAAICSCSFTAANPILDAAGIPRFGAAGQTPSDFTDKLQFMLHGSSAQAYAGAGYAVKRKGAKSIMGIGIDIAANYSLANYMKTGARVAGVKFLGFAAVPVGSTDFATVVQKLKDAKPDAVALFIAPLTYPAFFQTVREFGVSNVTFVMPAFAVGDPDLQALGSVADGLIAFSPVPPFSDTSFPIVKQYRDDMAGVGNCCRPYEFAAYIGVFALDALAKRVKGPVTKESLIATARNRKTGTISVAGLYSWQPWKRGPAAFPQAPNGTGWFEIVKSGKIVLDGPRKPFDLWAALKIAPK
jgi:ABC-type branched-subunit amino acid transport system substrate-binding protein